MRLLPVLLLAACSTGSQSAAHERTTPGPRGMRADAHLQAARDHEARAAELSRWPEMQRDPAGFDNPAGGLWYRKWDTAQDERAIAEHHRSEAAKLHVAFDEACANIPKDHVTVSPFQRHGIGGFPTAAGVVVMLSNGAGSADALVAELRCHRAWMMLGAAGMEDCPLDLPNITVEAYGDATGVSIEIKANDPTAIPELQRRAAKDLERSMAHAMQ